jgi:predicted dehydrogenase
MRAFYSELPGSRLTAVYDTNIEAAKEAARKFQCEAATSLEHFADLIDAATICTPTITHHGTGMALLERANIC